MHALDKLYDTIIKEQIDKFIEENDIIPDNMHGSRKGHSTISAKLNIDEAINV